MASGSESLPILLVTGASGFLGGHVAWHARKHHKVFATYCRHPFSLFGLEVLELDLTVERKVRAELGRIRPDAIIHAAAFSDLDYCETHHREAEAVNVKATAFLADWCAKHDARMVYVSSDMAFDGKKGHYVETDVPRPINFYGLTKVRGEETTRTACPSHVVARSALIYGRPLTGGSSFSTWIEGRLRKKQAVPLFVDQFRTPIFVRDLALALLELANDSFVGTIHLGGPERIDRYSFGQTLARLDGHYFGLLERRSMDSFLAAAKRPRDVSFCIDKAKKILQTKLLDVKAGLLEALRPVPTAEVEPT